MKNSVWIIIVIVAAILAFLIGYSLAPRTDAGKGMISAPAGGYGHGGGYGAATGGYGGAAGGYGGAAGGYGGGYGGQAGGYGAQSGGYGAQPGGSGGH